ncbi:MAG: class I SAM-dependent methyltransferase [Nitriliruptoraceae bacterium]
MDPAVLDAVRALTAPEDDAMLLARERTGTSNMPPDPQVGSMMAWAARSLTAKAVVEVGSSGGVSGLWLLRGMDGQGLLTSVEPVAHAHALASDAYTDSGAPGRVRAILGDPLTVLPRLTDGAYDLMVLQTAPHWYTTLFGHAKRLLRPGGMLIARGVLRKTEHADELVAFIEAAVRDDELPTTILPMEDGIAFAIRQAPAPAERPRTGSRVRDKR